MQAAVSGLVRDLPPNTARSPGSADRSLLCPSSLGQNPPRCHSRCGPLSKSPKCSHLGLPSYSIQVTEQVATYLKDSRLSLRSPGTEASSNLHFYNFLCGHNFTSTVKLPQDCYRLSYAPPLIGIEAITQNLEM